MCIDLFKQELQTGPTNVQNFNVEDTLHPLSPVVLACEYSAEKPNRRRTGSRVYNDVEQVKADGIGVLWSSSPGEVYIFCHDLRCLRCIGVVVVRWLTTGGRSVVFPIFG